MRLLNITAVLLLLGLIFPDGLPCLPREENGEKILTVKKASTAPRIDGLLNDPCWGAVEPVSGFFQYDPVNGASASEETLVWTVYSKTHIYFAFLMKDSQPEKIWAELTPRNEYEDNDSITVILDTYNDKRTSIQFTVNPRGVQKNSTETIWKSGAVRRKDGWSAEIAIPFKSLRFSSKKTQIWGVNFLRYISRLKETDYWTRVDRDIAELQQLGALKGLEGVKPSYNIELFPYLGYRSSRWDGDSDDKFAVGLDFKYGILPNLILDMTASPDFSEVESDPFIYQRSPHENYFQENRPFFTEGSQFFSGGESQHHYMRPSQFNLFYSRRIQSPKFAAKLTGKTSGWAFGILGAFNKGDEAEGIEDNFFSVVRVQKDVLKNSQVGFYYAGMDESDDYNRNLGIDYNFNFLNVYYIRGQSAFSFNKGHEGGRNGMHVFQFEREADAGLQFKVDYRRIEEDVEVKTGYIRETNIQDSELQLGYAWRFNNKKIKRINWEIQGNFQHDCEGNLTRRALEFSGGIDFLSRLYLYTRGRTGQSKYQILGGDYEMEWSRDFIDIYGIDLGASWSRSGFFKGLSIRSEWDHKGIYNENFTAVEPGIEMDLDLSLTFRPRSNVELSLGIDWTKQISDSTGKTVFEGATYQTHLHYQITRQFFLSSRLKGESRDDQHNLDLLLGYYFGAGNIIQLSYKNSSRIESGLKANGHSITLKISYLLRI
jgi:hypothetical protein